MIDDPKDAERLADIDNRIALFNDGLSGWYVNMSEVKFLRSLLDTAAQERDNLQKALADIVAESTGRLAAYSAACEERDTAARRVEALEAELSTRLTEAEAQELVGLYDAATAKIEALEAEVSRLRQALKDVWPHHHILEDAPPAADHTEHPLLQAADKALWQTLDVVHPGELAEQAAKAAKRAATPRHELCRQLDERDATIARLRAGVEKMRTLDEAVIEAARKIDGPSGRFFRAEGRNAEARAYEELLRAVDTLSRALAARDAALKEGTEG